MPNQKEKTASEARGSEIDRIKKRVSERERFFVYSRLLARGPCLVSPPQSQFLFYTYTRRDTDISDYPHLSFTSKSLSLSSSLASQSWVALELKRVTGREEIWVLYPLSDILCVRETVD